MLHKLWVAALISGFVLQPASVNATTELVLQLDASWRQDSNPLRFAQDTNISTVLGTDKQSDSIQANDLRFSVIHPLDSPETRLMLSGQLGQRNFGQLTQLNNTEHAYKAAFEWRRGELWRGALSHSQTQQLYGYENGTLTSREMTHSTADNAELALRVSPDIEIPVAISRRQLTYDSPVNWAFDNEERSSDVAVRFKSTTGSNFRVGVRSTDVIAPRRSAAQISSLDSGFKDKEIYAQTNWQYSVLTGFGGRIASLQRAYANLDTMNFSALTTELNVNHEFSPKTRVTLDVWKRPYGITDPATLYALGTGAQLGTRWQASAKTRISLQASNETQRYYASNLALGQSNAELTRRRLGGGVDYEITRGVRLYADGYRDQLSRGTLGADIEQNVFRIGLEYTYENMPGVAERANLGGKR